MLRRQFLTLAAPVLLSPLAGAHAQVARAGGGDRTVKLFLAGDVMTGRGIDQILPHKSSPEIYEQWLRSARDYIEVAERVSGPIPREVDYRYIWGDALPALEAAQPEARIINLETAVTTCDEHWPGKGIHYRMHPGNAPVLEAAAIDCCALANNHVLDWGYDGLKETLQSLRQAGVAIAGAGEDRARAMAPAVIDAGRGRRVLVFSLGHGSSGVPSSWSAGGRQAGVWRLAALSGKEIDEVSAVIKSFKRPGDLAVASIHWGGNWGYALDPDMRHFAHDLLDKAGVDLVHGHSSHHPRGIEVYRDRLILYGCGDFINDYEGIRGREALRADLRVMYLPEIEAATGEIKAMRMPIFRRNKFRLSRAGEDDVSWLAAVLDRESGRLGATRVEAGAGELVLRWG
jgi:poly-gamma-glutamate synthesis protein (capsule biosynthesis protein)